MGFLRARRGNVAVYSLRMGASEVVLVLLLQDWVHAETEAPADNLSEAFVNVLWVINAIYLSYCFIISVYVLLDLRNGTSPVILHFGRNFFTSTLKVWRDIFVMSFCKEVESLTPLYSMFILLQEWYHNSSNGSVENLINRAVLVRYRWRRGKKCVRGSEYQI